MPRINSKFLDAVVYLYPTKESAESGERVGGTGFIIGVPLGGAPDRYLTYLVTNAHCLRPNSARFIRVNTHAGDVAIFESDPNAWVFHHAGDDVAVLRFGFDKSVIRYSWIPQDELFVKGGTDEYGVGDDVFYVGRFITHDGKQRNTPTARFGNIAMLPEEPLITRDGRRQDSFLVESRSLPGYSGSPVCILPVIPVLAMGFETGPALKLLGIDWCHLRDFHRVLGPDKETPLPDKWWVEANSGMMGVVPAWKISEVLEEDDLVKDRENAHRLLQEAGQHVALDAQQDPEFEQFEELTRKLVKVPKKELDEKLKEEKD